MKQTHLFLLRSFILCFLIPSLSFTDFISVALCVQTRLSMQKLVKNLIAYNELVSGAFQTAFGFVNLQNVQGMALTIASL